MYIYRLRCNDRQKCGHVPGGMFRLKFLLITALLSFHKTKNLCKFNKTFNYNQDCKNIFQQIMRTEHRTQKIEKVLAHKQPDLTVVIENIHDPHNVSAILRSCDAVGVIEVQLIYTKETFPDIGKKSSASARKWIKRRNHRSVDSCYEFLHSNGFLIYATRITDNAGSLYDMDFTKKVALVFGNENRGVSDEAADKADGVFQIPMFGMIQSLNVSVACAVTLFEAFRQRREHGHYDTPKLTNDELQHLKKEWIEK